MKRPDKAERQFRRLREVNLSMSDRAGAVMALHDIGVCLLKQGKLDVALRTLADAYAEAVAHNVPEWIYRSAKDRALAHLEVGNRARAVTGLRRAAEREAKSGRWEIAARLWESLAIVSAEDPVEVKRTGEAFRNAIAARRRAESPAQERLRLIGCLFESKWNGGQFADAIAVLKEGIRLADHASDADQRARFRDQLGMCLQQLGDPAAAVAEHRTALRIARRLPSNILTENCLNNLGEALRKIGKPDQAIPCYVEAEALARQRKDVESEISVAHNRALALEDAGRFAQSAGVLRHCRDSAKKLKSWDQFVRALHGLANQAWRAAQPRVAIDLYRRSFALAKKRGLDEQLVGIAINYANALRHRSKYQQAFGTLAGVEEIAPATPDALLYFTELGKAAESAGQASRAITAYSTAQEIARNAGDRTAAAAVAASVAECLISARKLSRAKDVIASVELNGLPANEQVQLLTARLKLQLAIGDRGPAGRTFRRAILLASHAEMRAESVNLHMLLADEDWRNERSKVDALKAYTVAIFLAGQIDFESMLKAGAHVLGRLQGIRREDRVGRLTEYQSVLERWMKTQVSESDFEPAVRIGLWPLRIALAMARSGRTMKAISDREMTVLLRDEFVLPHGERSVAR